MDIFSRLGEARDLPEKWLKGYNEEELQELLGSMLPVEYLELKQAETSVLLRHYKRGAYPSWSPLKKGMFNHPQTGILIPHFKPYKYKGYYYPWISAIRL
jgi:hypothetical protein